MKFNTWRIFVVSLLLLAATHSCDSYLDQFNMDKLSEDVEFTPALSAPLIYGSFSLEDVLLSIDSNGLVSLDEDSLLYVYYTDTAYSVGANDIVVLPDQTTSEIYIESDINIPDWVTLGVGETYTFSKVEYMDFDIDEGDRIDSMIISFGNLNFDIYSEFRHTGVLNITSSNIFDPDGDTLDVSYDVGNLSGTFTLNEDVDLSDYKVIVEEDADSAYVAIFFNLELLKSDQGISLDEECGIVMTFEEMEFSHIFGKIAEREVINESHRLEIDFYDAVSSVLDVYFADPQLNIHVSNSFGLPVELDLQNVQARSTSDDLFYDLTFDPGTMPFNVLAPSVDDLGTTVTSSLYINRETSNVDEIIAKAPDVLDFTVVAGTGDVSGSTDQNFLLDTSKLSVELELVLPMWLRTEGYTLEDTVDLDLEGTLGDLSFVDSASVYLTTVNEWPMELDLQVYFMDVSYTILDSLFKENPHILEAAPIDDDGILDETLLEPYTVPVNFTGEELMKLDGTMYAYIKARASTADMGTKFVKFYSHYMMNYDLSIDALFKINPSEISGESGN